MPTEDQTPNQLLPHPDWVKEITVSMKQFTLIQKDIYDLLKGVPSNPHDEGLLGKVYEQEKRLDELEKDFERNRLTTVNSRLSEVETNIVKWNLHTHETRLVVIEKLKDRFFWTFVGACAVGSFAGWGITDLLKKIILKH